MVEGDERTPHTTEPAVSEVVHPVKVESCIFVALDNDSPPFEISLAEAGPV
jgi:hypothetical protein